MTMTLVYFSPSTAIFLITTHVSAADKLKSSVARLMPPPPSAAIGGYILMRYAR